MPAARLLTLLFLLLPGLINAQTQMELALDTGTSMSIKRFEASADDRPAERTLLLWLPSSRGLGVGYVPFALNMANYGVDTWVLDLHTTYMAPVGRRSFSEFELEDLLAVKRHALELGYQRVFILAVARGANFALEAGRLWQQSEDNGKLTLGYVFMAPHLIENDFGMGEQAEYRQIARSTNLPIYLIQPEFSTKYARLQEIIAALQTGGATVFSQKVMGAQGGYHMRPDEDLTERDLEARADMPELVHRAINLLAKMPQPQQAATLAPEASTGAQRSHRREPLLHAYEGNPSPAPLKLAQMGGGSIDLAALRGEVVLVNFWATWCGPCLEEIPSMAKLVDQMQGKDFHVLAVNIGEPPERIREWTRDMPINFPVLLDNDGDAVRDWKVYAYPSNFLIDREGRIRYSYRGALDWAAPTIVETIESLL